MIERYRPPRDGEHAPPALRDAFLEAIDVFRSWRGRLPEPVVRFRREDTPITVIVGLLWRCSDPLPGGAADELGIDGDKVTYGTAARRLKELIAQRLVKALR
jgi:hypothetical protein